MQPISKRYACYHAERVPRYMNRAPGSLLFTPLAPMAFHSIKVKIL